MADAVKLTKNKKIGVIGTPATINNGAHKRLIEELMPEAKVVTVGCPLFVPLVEDGWYSANDPVVLGVCEKYLKPIIDNGCDVLILGCTHYPLLTKTISKIAGPDVTLINAGAETARYIKEYLAKNDLCADTKCESQYKYYVSDSVDNFSCMADLFLGEHITDIKKIDIDKY